MVNTTLNNIVSIRMEACSLYKKYYFVKITQLTSSLSAVYKNVRAENICPINFKDFELSGL